MINISLYIIHLQWRQVKAHEQNDSTASIVVYIYDYNNLRIPVSSYIWKLYHHRITILANKTFVYLSVVKAVSILSESTYNQLCEANDKLDLMPSDIKLKSYTGHQIRAHV